MNLSNIESALLGIPFTNRDQKKKLLNDIKNEVVASVKDQVKEEVKKGFASGGQKAMIKKINKAVNIPLLNEKTEEKIFTALFKIIQAVLLKRLV